MLAKYYILLATLTKMTNFAMIYGKGKADKSAIY